MWTVDVFDGFVEELQSDGTFEGLNFLVDDDIVVGLGGSKPVFWRGFILVENSPDTTFEVLVLCDPGILPFV